MALNVLFASFVVGIVSLLFALYLIAGIKKEPAGTAKMQEISEVIHQGAMAFLNMEYKVMGIFMAVAAIALFFFLPEGGKLTIAFVIGCFFSAIAACFARPR